jgi:hypothetical protein
MELDDYKKTGKEAASAGGIAAGDGTGSLQGLIGDLKERDKQDRKALLLLISMFFIFVTIYLAQFGRQEGIMKAAYALLAGGFVLSLLHFYLKFRSYKKISYTEPVIRFLRAAERRYAYWTLSDILVSVPLITVMGIGGGMIVYHSFNKYFPGSPLPLIIFCLVYAAAIFVGFLAGKKQWEKSKKPLYDKIRQLRKEFGE